MVHFRLLLAAVIGALTAAHAATLELPVSCTAARRHVVPWLEARGFQLQQDTDAAVVLEGRKIHDESGKRLRRLGRFAKIEPLGQVSTFDDLSGCFGMQVLRSVSARVAFRDEEHGCRVWLNHVFFAETGDSCSGLSGGRMPVNSNSKLELRYLSALGEPWSRQPDPLPPPPDDTRPREVQVLFAIAPGQPQPSSLSTSLTADLAGTKPEVLAVREFPSELATRAVVVLDTANTHPSRYACLLAELAPLRSAIATGDIEVYLTDWLYAPFYRASFGGSGGNIMVATRRQIDSAADACKAADPATPGERSGAPSVALIRRIALAGRRGEGPARLFWISEAFGWFEGRLVDQPELETNNPHIIPESFLARTEAFTEMLSDASISIFPVIIPRAGNVINRFDRRAAAWFARLTGGYATEATEAPGVTLDKVLHQTAATAKVVTLRADITGRRWYNGLPYSLTVSDRSSGAKLRRAFTVHGAGVVAHNPEALKGADRLFVADESFQVQTGCAGSPSEGISIYLPDYVRTGPAGDLHVLIEYPHPTRRSMFQRIILRRDSPSGPVCLAMSKYVSGTRFRLLLFDVQTKWLGAINGELLANASQAQKTTR